MSCKRKSDIIVKIHRRKEVSEMANRILVVDDEAEIADLIEAYLIGEIIPCLSSTRQRKPLRVSTPRNLTLPFWT